MHALEGAGDLRAKCVNTLLARQDRLIGALLIGNNLVNILGSALATSVFLALFGQTGVAYATIAMTVMLVVFAEVLPKSWAISNPDRFALAVAPVIRRFVPCRRPVVEPGQRDRAHDPQSLRRRSRRECLDADRP